MEGLEFDSILSMEKRWVERQFTEEEVHQSIMSMKGDKAPGPDGFPSFFFQRCWDIVKGDLMNVFYKSFIIQRSFIIF